MEMGAALPSPEHSQWVEMCNRFVQRLMKIWGLLGGEDLPQILIFDRFSYARKIPRSVVCHLFQLLDRRSLAVMAQVSRTFR